MGDFRRFVRTPELFLISSYPCFSGNFLLKLTGSWNSIGSCSFLFHFSSFLLRRFKTLFLNVISKRRFPMHKIRPSRNGNEKRSICFHYLWLWALYNFNSFTEYIFSVCNIKKEQNKLNSFLNPTFFISNDVSFFSKFMWNVRNDQNICCPMIQHILTAWHCENAAKIRNNERANNVLATTER